MPHNTRSRSSSIEKMNPSNSTTTSTSTPPGLFVCPTHTPPGNPGDSTVRREEDGLPESEVHTRQASVKHDGTACLEPVRCLNLACTPYGSGSYLTAGYAQSSAWRVCVWDCHMKKTEFHIWSHLEKLATKQYEGLCHRGRRGRVDLRGHDGGPCTYTTD
jgi:hypothetical protein